MSQIRISFWGLDLGSWFLDDPGYVALLGDHARRTVRRLVLLLRQLSYVRSTVLTRARRLRERFRRRIPYAAFHRQLFGRGGGFEVYIGWGRTESAGLFSAGSDGMARAG